VFGVVAGIVLARSQRSKLLGMPALLETQPDMNWLSFAQCSLSRLVIGKSCIEVYFLH